MATIPRKRITTPLLLLVTFVAGMALSWLMLRTQTINRDHAIQLKAPLMLSASGPQSDSDTSQPYLLPPGTVLYPQQSYAEGHGRYLIEVFYKGMPPGERIKHTPTSSTSLWAFYAEQ